MGLVMVEDEKPKMCGACKHSNQELLDDYAEHSMYLCSDCDEKHGTNAVTIIIFPEEMRKRVHK